MRDIEIDRIDKGKFFLYGLGSFSVSLGVASMVNLLAHNSLLQALSTALYPLTVIKTNQQVASGQDITTRQTIVKIWKNGGIRAFYNGYGTVILGMVPARMLYLSSLEMIKSLSLKTGRAMGLNETYLAGSANFVAGGISSLVTQLVTVPIDVVSQRQMVARLSLAPSPTPPSSNVAASTPSSSGRSIHTLIHPSRSIRQPSSSSFSSASSSGQVYGPSAYIIVKQIIKEEGVIGFYRGLGASIATFVPSSAIWWGSYGVYQKLIWQYVYRKGQEARNPPPTYDIVAIQAVSAAAAGLTSGGLTAPLDMIKTRIQVARKREGQGLTFRHVLAEALKEGGVIGLWSSAGPRMLNGALWGTCSVTVYEALKRTCVKD